MMWLVVASILWACSFGLIKHRLVAVGLDPLFVALVRLLLSLLLFLPFLRPARLGRALAVRLVLLGGVQYGLMYVTYMLSYRHLAAHEVALFTIFTPLYVALCDDAFSHRFRPRLLGVAALAVVGAGVVVGAGPDLAARLAGVLLLQVSNLCFAFGQVAYRRLMGAGAVPPATPGGAAVPRDRDVFALLYLGGALVAAVPAMMGMGAAGLPVLDRGQMLTLLYLGLVPSGLCFFLWNAGARRTSAATLAVMNNAKVPLGMVASLLLFGETADPRRLALGGLLLAAAVVASGRIRR